MAHLAPPVNGYVRAKRPTSTIIILVIDHDPRLQRNQTEAKSVIYELCSNVPTRL
jgi:hypothetical protein